MLLKFRNTMRDGGWKRANQTLQGKHYRPCQRKERQEKKKEQLYQSQKLSEPKNRTSKYTEELEKLKSEFYPKK